MGGHSYMLVDIKCLSIDSPFDANFTPMPPLFPQSTPNDPLFPIIILYQILYANCKFAHASRTFLEIYKCCGNFNIGFANFGLKLHFGTLNDPHFWKSTSVSGSWKLPLPAPATTVAKNQCLTCCLTCCFWCWISHWVLLILSWNMWLRGRSGGLWLGRDPGGVGGSVKIGDWVFDLVGVFPWLRSFGLTFRLLVLREYSYLGVYLSAVTIWSMPFVLVSCC